MGFLKGKRTYIVAALMVILTGLHGEGYLADPLYNTLHSVLLAGGLAALRAGIGNGR